MTPLILVFTNAKRHVPARGMIALMAELTKRYRVQIQPASHLDNAFML